MFSMDGRRKKLNELYASYEEEVAEFKKAAVCTSGCAFCCTDVGNIDINTLEGIIIQERVSTLGEQAEEINARLVQNKREREKGRHSRCPFLKEDSTCIIYDIRPFSCRQLYSVRLCISAPVVHRQAVEAARQTVRKIQQLDMNGYSGHISYILYLLAQKVIRNQYLLGKSDPGKIADFGKSHGILINRFAASGRF
ncbi:MAG: YkgJ family cysteine cluster protein [Pseudomonadota bacterium]